MSAADVTATPRRREAELLRLPGWCGTTAASLAVFLGWAATTWIALHLKADTTLHTAALFVHLASLVLGFGAVLAIDYYGALWITGRKTLSEVLDFTAPLHVPVWAGLGGLLFSGAFLHPDLSSPLTCVKLGLVLVLSLNGVQASALHRRLAATDGVTVPRSLMVRGALTASVSQAAWWGAAAIGFLNSQR
ncbi:hypothetical protein [Streptomyces sp. TBY4]|uniref:hypothetical protein n=1 Tax=Streptomyces sp. TBY4 TaxID=2962030 RepID=UPI0020B68195|nr:hypothetical protein [Streptomyces sp. TBY4]MCP3754196.1 hypothetical protein [Streptomyces sp. TBY4]